MGNCCDRCFGRLSKRKYLRTRYNVERDFSIEFENLMDDENQQEEINNVVTPRERILLSQRQYGALMEEQARTDQQIDSKLVQQEEELRREEEAYYEAKRAAAHAAKIQKQWEQAGKTNQLMLKNGSKWVGEDDNDWDIAGGEDDFEMFLENVKARSLAARTRALDSQVPVDQQSTSSLTSKDRTDDAGSSLDLEWEHEAGMQPPPKRDKKKHQKEDANLLAELAVKPYLHLKDKQDSFSNDFEWDSDIGGDNSSDQNSESRTLLSNSTETVER